MIFHIDTYKIARNKMEKKLFTGALIMTKGNQVHAANMLEMNRGTFLTKCKKLGLLEKSYE